MNAAERTERKFNEAARKINRKHNERLVRLHNLIVRQTGKMHDRGELAKSAETYSKWTVFARRERVAKNNLISSLEIKWWNWVLKQELR